MRAHIPWSTVVLFFACFICALRSSAQDTQEAQDVAGAARQEKVHKVADAKQQSHVYTNDDLRQPHVLNQQDRARVEARKKSAPPPQTLEPAPALDANGDSPAESLGEVARRYRREKAANASEQASRPKPPSPFRMDLSQPTFAGPAPAGPPLSAPHAPLAPIAPPASAAKPSLSLAPLKRNPFSRPALPPSLRGPNLGPAPLIIAPVKPSPVAPSAPAPAPAKPTHTAPPTIAVAPAKPAPVSLAPPPHTSTLASPPKIAVQPGDSLWKLSRRFLGAGSRWQEWLSSNPGLSDPHLIQPGTALVVPRAASLAPSHTLGKVLVHQGDSLWKIALTHYGNGSAWQCVAAANPTLRNPAEIHPGQALLLPSSCTPSFCCVPPPAP